MREYLSPDELKPDTWAMKFQTNQKVWDTLAVGIHTIAPTAKGSLPEETRPTIRRQPLR